MSDDKKESNRAVIIAAVIGAVAVLLAALITAKATYDAAKPDLTPIPVSIMSSPTSSLVPPLILPSATSNMITNPSPQPTEFPANLTGTWTGNGKDIVNGVAYDTSATVTVSVPCGSGRICGQVFIPTITCSFTLTFLYENNGRFYFKESNYVGKCGNATLDYLEPLSNGNLLFHSEGDFGVADVTMSR